MSHGPDTRTYDISVAGTKEDYSEQMKHQMTLLRGADLKVWLSVLPGKVTEIGADAQRPETLDRDACIL